MSLFAAEASPHDAVQLTQQWRRLARKAPLTETLLHTTPDGHPILGYTTASCSASTPSLYISAGVHGDEAAPPWALLAWAWQHSHLLRQLPLLICPCINPHGLISNTRTNEKGYDLNRHFHSTRLPLIRAWQQWVQAQPISSALCLHEDYDARGCYLYALGAKLAPRATLLLRSAEEHIPLDPRRRIEGSPARHGLIHRSTPPPDIQGPEAILLFSQYGCPFTYTFETPSEYSLDERLSAQQSVISTYVQLHS
jgi:murein peptide amidase A